MPPSSLWSLKALPKGSEWPKLPFWVGFHQIPGKGVHGQPSIPEKFLLFAKVHLTVWWSLWLSYFLKVTQCIYRHKLITIISMYWQKVVPLDLRGDQQPLEPFNTNDGYYRYWSSLTQFEMTLIQILPYSIEIARGCPCRNTTMTCQFLIGSE